MYHFRIFRKFKSEFGKKLDSKKPNENFAKYTMHMYISLATYVYIAKDVGHEMQRREKETKNLNLVMLRPRN